VWTVAVVVLDDVFDVVGAVAWVSRADPPWASRLVMVWVT